MTKIDFEDGVWRTVGGRRIFIKDGQDLASAMKESGKFKNTKKIKVEGYSHKIDEDYEERLAKYKEIQKDANKKYDNGEIDREERNKLIDDAHDKYIKQKNDEAKTYMQDQFKAFDKGDISGAELEQAKKDSGLSKTEIEEARNYVNNRAPESYPRQTENKTGNTTSQPVPKEKNNVDVKTAEVMVRGTERSLEFEKDGLARAKRDGQSVENISDRTRRVHELELQLQKDKEHLERVKAKSNNSNYEDYYKKEKLGTPSDFKEGTKVEVRSSYNEKYSGTIVREATNEEKQNHINTNLKGYIVKDSLGNESVVADTKIKELEKTNTNKGVVPQKSTLNTMVEKNGDIAEKIIEDDEWNDIRVVRYGNGNTVIKNERTGKNIKITPSDTKESLNKKIEDSYKYRIPDTKMYTTDEKDQKGNNQINDALRKKAYQKYLKEHPASKISFEDFIDMNKVR